MMDSIEPNQSIIQWKPTEAQREAKARFYDRIKDSFRSLESYSVTELMKLSESTSLRSWMQDPSFTSWWYNENSVYQKMLSTQELAVDTLIEVLKDRDIGPKGTTTRASQIRAAELLLNYTGLSPTKKTEVTQKTEAIGEMNSDELKEFLAAQMKQEMTNMSPDEIKELLGDNLDRIKDEDNG